MAGLYPDAPSRRMAYDDDGTVVLGAAVQASHTGVPEQAAGTAVPLPYTDFDTEDVADINDEDAAISLSVGASTSLAGFLVVGLIFPELREVDGYFRNGHTLQSAQSWLYYSGNTTNGRDGTWSALGSQVLDTATDLEQYRTDIVSAALSNVRGIMSFQRSQGTGGASQIRRFHVYGDITPGETPDRLLWLDEATGLEFTAPIDFAEIPRGSSEDFEVRLRNNSETLTATTVQYTAESLFQNSAAWYTWTLPGGATFQGTRQIASIAPETTTGIITGRRVTADTEIVGLHAARVHANVGTWS